MGKSIAQKAHEIYEKDLANLQKELYIQAFIAYEELKEEHLHMDKPDGMKGTLVQKKQIRKKGEKSYCYTYHYIQVTEYKEGKRKIKRQYVPQEQVQQVMEELQRGKKAKCAEKEALQQKQALLRESEKQLQKHIRQGLLPPLKTIRQEAAQRYEQHKQADRYRTQQVKQTQTNPAYKIRTEAGELVLSKNECIVANMLYHQKIPYFYEKPLKLKPRRDGTPVILHPDFTIQIGEKEVYIEILGMMGKEDYATSWEYRLATYKVNHIRLGKNLVAMEFPTAEQHQEIDCFKILQVISKIAQKNIPQTVVACGIN